MPSDLEIPGNCVRGTGKCAWGQGVQPTEYMKCRGDPNTGGGAGEKVTGGSTCTLPAPTGFGNMDLDKRQWSWADAQGKGFTRETTRA